MNLLTIDHVLQTQKDFNSGRFYDFENADEKQRQAFIKDNVLHMMAEAHEVLQHVSWKMHKPEPKSVDEFAMAVELVDVLKFWGNLAAASGFDHRLLADIFIKKSRIVEGRHFVAGQLPASGPEVYVDYEMLKRDTTRTLVHLAMIHDAYDCSFVVCTYDHTGIIRLDSEMEFELEYIMTGLGKFRWRLNNDEKAKSNFMLRLSYHKDQYIVGSLYGVEFVRELNDATSLLMSCLEQHLKEVLVASRHNAK